MNAISDFIRGLRTYWTGVAWLRRHPKVLLSLFIPWVGGFFSIIFSFTAFLDRQDAIMAAILFEPGQSFWWQILFYISYGLVWLGAVVLALVIGILAINVIAAPLYEWVSVKVERDLRGGQVSEVSLWQSIRLIPEELKKAVFIIMVPLLVTLIPGLNVLSFLATGFMLGWDFYDYPLARRGWRLRQRIEFARDDFWTIMGFGLWMAIPFVQFLLIPLAIAGATILNIERAEQETVAKL